MNIRITSRLLFILLIPCCSLKVFASQNTIENQTSERDVQYQDFSISREELEQGRTETCTVTVSQPYSYSTQIPKEDNTENNTTVNNSDNNENSNVQTGDNTPVAFYFEIVILSIIGMMGFKLKNKK